MVFKRQHGIQEAAQGGATDFDPWREHDFLRLHVLYIGPRSLDKNLQKGTLARADIVREGYSILGRKLDRVSGWGFNGNILENPLRVGRGARNVSSERHAEANALFTLWLLGGLGNSLKGEHVRIWTDREPCMNCSDPSGLYFFGLTLGLKRLDVFWPPFNSYTWYYGGNGPY